MNYVYALPLILTPSLALAELGRAEQAALDTILPALEVSLEEQGGAAFKDIAPLLGTCIVTTANRREVRRLGDGALDDRDTALLNEIMARPDVQGCVAKGF